MTQSFDVVIVGGGSAGISVAARLAKSSRPLRVAIIDPAQNHYYQPLWTLVGAGAVDFTKTVRSQASVIPQGVSWLQDRVTAFAPDKNVVKTSSHGDVAYGHLVVCPGIQIDWGKITGLEATLGKNGVCSNYSETKVTETWKTIREFEGGTALFTFPNTPVKCAGAPQKIMYLADDYFRRTGIRDRTKIIFYSAAPSIFAVKKYADSLNRIVKERNIDVFFKHNLEAVDGERKQATFRNLESNEATQVPFDMIHVAPPMSAPDFIKESPLANEGGWVDVDKHSLRHHRYANIFGLGDASSLPTSKTGAAIRKQVPVVVSHILGDLSSNRSSESYDGYTSCPLVTGYGKLILAEFDYDGQPRETFPFDQGKERRSMYLLKKHGLPRLYWHGMLKGRA